MATKPDAAAAAALAERVRRPVEFAWLDIDGSPIRVTNAPYPFTFAGTGDEDLDGHVFDALDERLVNVGAIKTKEGGGDTVTLTLMGLTGLDGEMMDEISDRERYQGREARLWRAMLDPQNLTRLGSIWCYYTGYMSVPKVMGNAQSQTISLEIESYLSFFGAPSGRTYLDQQSFDPADHSAELAIAIANGMSKRTQ